jgi:transcriptional regulator with XRE-family HTH domain
MEKTIYSQQYAQFLQLLRAVREESGFTQADLASRLGATQSFVSKCERGDRRLDVVELRAWCAALEIPFLKFLRRFEESCQRRAQLR